MSYELEVAAWCTVCGARDQMCLSVAPDYHSESFCEACLRKLIERMPATLMLNRELRVQRLLRSSDEVLRRCTLVCDNHIRYCDVQITRGADGSIDLRFAVDSPNPVVVTDLLDDEGYRLGNVTAGNVFNFTYTLVDNSVFWLERMVRLLKSGDDVLRRCVLACDNGLVLKSPEITRTSGVEVEFRFLTRVTEALAPVKSVRLVDDEGYSMKESLADEEIPMVVGDDRTFHYYLGVT